MRTKTNLRCGNKLPQILFGTALCATIMLTGGCSNDNETALPDGGDRVALQVTSGIQSRAIGSDWQAGDAIGIYMLKTGTSTITEAATNRRYTTADGNSSFSATADQTIYFPVDGSQVDFYAYYPHLTQFDENGEAVFDVSDQTKQPSFDLMTAKLNSTAVAPLDKNNPAVAFKFNHRMTKIELNIAAGTGLIPSDLAGLTVEITNQRTEGLFNPVFDATGVNLTAAKTVTMLTAADGLTSSAILLPCYTEASYDNQVIPGRELLFTLTSGEVFRWPIPDTKSFNEGDRNIYNITMNRTGITVTATIEDWNPGNGLNGEGGSAE